MININFIKFWIVWYSLGVPSFSSVRDQAFLYMVYGFSENTWTRVLIILFLKVYVYKEHVCT